MTIEKLKRQCFDKLDELVEWDEAYDLHIGEHKLFEHAIENSSKLDELNSIYDLLEELCQEELMQKLKR